MQNKIEKPKFHIRCFSREKDHSADVFGKKILVYAGIRSKKNEQRDIRRQKLAKYSIVKNSKVNFIKVRIVSIEALNALFSKSHTYDNLFLP